MKTILSILILVAIIYFAIKYFRTKNKKYHLIYLYKNGFTSVTEYVIYLRGMVEVMRKFDDINNDYVKTLIENLESEIEPQKPYYDLERIEWYVVELNKFIK